MGPTAVLPSIRSMRAHCFRAPRDVAKNVQRFTAVAAGHLFATGENKAVRHLLARDMLHWLLYADNDITLQFCRACGKCGPHLLGRFNKATVQSLMQVCVRTNHSACRSAAIKAVRHFLETDRSLCPAVGSRLPALEQLTWESERAESDYLAVHCMFLADAVQRKLPVRMDASAQLLQSALQACWRSLRWTSELAATSWPLEACGSRAVQDSWAALFATCGADFGARAPRAG